MCLAREFQREGVAMEKALSPGLVLGPEWWRQEVGIKGAESAGGSVWWWSRFGEVGGGPGYGRLCD